MPSLIVVVKTPAVDDPPRVLQSQEQFSIQQFVPHLSVERLEVAVFRGTALGNIQRVDAGLGQPAAHAASNELRPHLEQCFDEAEPGEEFVIRRYRRRNSNPRTPLMKIIRRAGLKPWPKLFQNLRSTRETELADEFPIQVVCDWIGNTEAIASKHSLRVTEDHCAKAVQNPVQQPAVLSRTNKGDTHIC